MKHTYENGYEVLLVDFKIRIKTGNMLMIAGWTFKIHEDAFSQWETPAMSASLFFLDTPVLINSRQS